MLGWLAWILRVPMCRRSRRGVDPAMALAESAPVVLAEAGYRVCSGVASVALTISRPCDACRRTNDACRRTNDDRQAV